VDAPPLPLPPLRRAHKVVLVRRLRGNERRSEG
jgi:hypothetical protein